MDAIEYHSGDLTTYHGSSTSESSRLPPIPHAHTPGPVSRLVLEVLMEVFKYCSCEIPESWPQQLQRRPDDPLPVLLPLTVASVSSEWRMVALSTPRLWATMGWGLQRETGLGGTIELTKVWLKRSRKVPLFLAVICNFDCAPLLELFLPESNRWEFINFVMPPEMHDLVSTAVRGNLLNLVDLNLSIVYPSFEEVEDSMLFPDIQHPYLAYEFAPKLQTVDLSYGFCLHTMKVPSSNLTHWIGYGVINDLWFLLNEAPALESCSLLAEEDQHFVPGPTATFPKQYLLRPYLTALHAGAGDMAEFLKVADHLHLPNLRDLSFCFKDDFTPWSSSTLTSFLDRSPNLMTFNLTAPIVGERLVEMLEHMQELHTLNLFDRTSDDNDDDDDDEWVPPTPILRGLPSTILPKLHTLVVNVTTGFPWDSLFELLESRMPESDGTSTDASGVAPARLQNLRLHYLHSATTPSLDDATIRRFDDIMARGLNVKIHQLRYNLGGS